MNLEQRYQHTNLLVKQLQEHNLLELKHDIEISFHKFIRQLLIDLGCDNIQVIPNWFEIHGYFVYQAEPFYFRLSDIRFWNCLLFRQTTTYGTDKGGFNMTTEFFGRTSDNVSEEIKFLLVCGSRCSSGETFQASHQLYKSSIIGEVDNEEQ